VNEQIGELSDQDKHVFEQMRSWLRGHFKKAEEGKYDTIEGKLCVVDAILRNGWLDKNNAWQLQALGLGFGDAISQQLGMSWTIITDSDGSVPALVFRGTSLKLFAFTAIQKRMAMDEPVDVFPLFDAFCSLVERRRPKSFLERLSSQVIWLLRQRSAK